MITPVRSKLLSLSLFHVVIPENNPRAFLDNADSLWQSFDRYGVLHKLETIQFFTIGQGLPQNKPTSLKKGNTVFCFVPKQPMRFLFSVLKDLRDSSVVLLHNESFLDVCVGIASKLLGARVAVFFHNAKHPMNSKLPRFVIRFFRNNIADAFLTNSPEMKRLYKPYLRHPVFLFSFGVHPSFSIARKRTFRKDLRILFVGRISPEKRIEDIVEGIAKSRNRDGIQFMIVGQDPTPGQQYWQSLVRRMKDRRVRYQQYGFVPHSRLVSLYREADVFINLRPDEGFGKVFIEAMASGLPVVAKKGSPGPESIIRHGHNGFLVDSDQQLAELLEKKLEKRSMRMRIGAAAQRHVHERYSLKHSHTSLTRALDALCAGFVVEDDFYRSRPFASLRRVKRILLNERVDKCNHLLVNGVAVHREQHVLIPYCKGRGIDVGCGSNKTHPDAIGVDLIPEGKPGLFGIQRGRTSTADIQTSGDDLHMFRKGELDYVVSRHNLQHYKDPAKTLREWRRVVRIGGIIGIVIPDNTFIDTRRLDPSHYNDFTPESFRNQVETIGGLKILRLEPCVEDWSFVCVMQKV